MSIHFLGNGNKCRISRPFETELILKAAPMIIKLRGIRLFKGAVHSECVFAFYCVARGMFSTITLASCIFWSPYLATCHVTFTLNSQKTCSYNFFFIPLPCVSQKNMSYAKGPKNGQPAHNFKNIWLHWLIHFLKVSWYRAFLFHCLLHFLLHILPSFAAYLVS